MLLESKRGTNMYKKKSTENIIYENLRVIQTHPAFNGAIHLHLDTYTQILNVFSSTNEEVRHLIDELNGTTCINEATNDEKINLASTTKKVEMIMTEKIVKIQNNPSLKKSISFHARVYRQILNAVHSTDKELIDKLGQLKYESFKSNLDDLYISNNQ